MRVTIESWDRATEILRIVYDLDLQVEFFISTINRLLWHVKIWMCTVITLQHQHDVQYNTQNGH